MRIARVLVLGLLPSIAAAQPIQPVQLLHQFTSSPSHPNGALVQVPDGSFYGVTDDAIYRVAAGGAVSIVARITDGRLAEGALVRGPDGALYGTTQYGGRGGRGLVFRFDPVTSEVRTLHAFEGANEGGIPVGGLTVVGGFLYGVTDTTIFRTDPATGATVTQYIFPPLENGSPNNAALPSGPLAVGPDGLLYGTTRFGQATGEGGALYRFDPTTRAVTVLHQFTGQAAWPIGRLVLGPDSRFYGAAQGDFDTPGTVYRFDPASSAFEILHTFGGSDGARPGPLLMTPDGSLYGTTHRTTPNEPDTALAIFRLRPGPGGYTLETVRAFDPPVTGAGVRVQLTLGADALVYGYAQTAGPAGAGTIYRLDPASNPLVFTVLDAFAPTTTWLPSAPAPGGGGFLYGTTSRGGANQRGAAYRLDPVSGAVTIVGHMPGPVLPTQDVVNSALVHDPIGTMYGTATLRTSTLTENRLVAVNEVTGAITVPLQTSLAGVSPLPPDSAPVRGPDGALYFTRGSLVMRAGPGVTTLSVAGVPPDHGTFGFTQLTPLLAASDGRIYVGVATSVEVGQAPVSFQTTIRLMRVNPAAPALDEVAMVPQARAAVALVQGADGGLYLADNSAVHLVDPVARTSRVACSLVGPSYLFHLTAVPDGRLVGLLEGGGTYARQQLAICTPSTGAVDLRTMPEGIGRFGAPLVAAGGWLYGATVDATGDPAFSSGPTPAQPGGALLRLALDGTLPALDTDGDGLPNTWETAYGIDPFSATGGSGGSDDPDGDGRTNAQELAEGTHPRGVLTRYFAEGATGPFFRTRFDIGNPTGGRAATVLLRFLTDTGSRVAAQVIVPPSSHLSIDPGAIAGLGNATFSTVVESDQTVAVDRAMAWDATGYGSHVETGVIAPSTTWYFAEGSTSGPFALFYLLQNPQTTAVVATVRYLRPGGLPPIDRTYTLPAASRTTIAVDAEGAELASTDVSAVITAPSPIVAERAMYFTQGGQPFAAGHESAGVTAPALEWFLAEGATGDFFDLFVLLANPNASAANVTVEYLLVGGGTLSKNYVVAANSRATIWVDDEQLPAASGQKPLANVAVSMTVRSTNAVPIIVERTMWWPGPAMTAAFWYEAHNSPGATAAATRWLIAGGEEGGSAAAQTYVLLANPSSTATRVRVTRLEDHSEFGLRHEINLPAKSRTNLAFEAPWIDARRFSVLVESLGVDPVPIVVEHATYTSPGGVVWGSGGAALAAPLP